MCHLLGHSVSPLPSLPCRDAGKKTVLVITAGLVTTVTRTASCQQQHQFSHSSRGAITSPCPSLLTLWYFLNSQNAVAVLW